MKRKLLVRSLAAGAVALALAGCAVAPSTFNAAAPLGGVSVQLPAEQRTGMRAINPVERGAAGAPLAAPAGNTLGTSQALYSCGGK